MKIRTVKRIDGYLRLPNGNFNPTIRLCMFHQEKEENITNETLKNAEILRMEELKNNKTKEEETFEDIRNTKDIIEDMEKELEQNNYFNGTYKSNAKLLDSYWVNGEFVDLEDEESDIENIFYVLLPSKNILKDKEKRSEEDILVSDYWIMGLKERLIPVFVEHCGKSFVIMGFRRIPAPVKCKKLY